MRKFLFVKEDNAILAVKQHYLSLKDNEQQCVQIMLFYADDIKANTILAEFSRMASRSTMTVYETDLKILMVDMQKIGYFDFTNKKYSFKEEVSDFLFQLVMPNNTYLSKYLSNHLFSWSYYHNKSMTRDHNLIKAGFLSNDIGLFNASLNKYYGSLYEVPVRNIFSVLLPDFENGQTLQSLKPEMFGYVLSKFFIHSGMNLINQSEITERLYDQIINKKAKVNHLAAASLSFQLMLQGDFDKVEKVIPLMDEVHQLYATGMLKTITNSKEATAYFETGEKIIKKVMKADEEYQSFHPQFEIFQCLAYMISDEPNAHIKMEKIAKRMSKTESRFFAKLGTYLWAYCHYKNNNADNANANLAIDSHKNFEFYIKTLVRYLVDKDKIVNKSLKDAVEISTNAAYYYVANELNYILKQSLDTHQDFDTELKANSTPIMMGNVRILENWENALEALINIRTGGSSSKKSDVVGASRLIYLIDFEAKSIQPKEQLMGKTGWSSGRNIALARLKKQEFSNLTDQDRKTTRHIKEIDSGYWGSTTLEFDFEAAILELVGHPLLFLMKSPTVSLTLEEEEPEIKIIEKGDNFEIVLSHGTHAASDFYYRKETPTRFKVLKATSEYKAIAKIMNGTKLTVPKAAKSKFLDAVNSISNFTTVKSSLAEDIENLPKIKPNSNIYVHLLPVGDGFHIETFVKPFTTVAPYFRPGQGDETAISIIEGKRVRSERKLKEEKKNLAELLANTPLLTENKASHDVWELDELEDCLDLLSQLLPQAEAGKISIEWPKGEKFRVTKVFGMDSLRVNVKSKTDWFEVSGEIQVDEGKVLDLQYLIELSQQAKGQFIELSPGNFVALTRELQNKLKLINSSFQTGKDGKLQLSPLAAPLMDELFGDSKSFKTDAKWKESMTKLRKAFEKTFDPPKHFEATFRSYQLEGYQWLSRLADWGVGACLADDMGLGKTIQTLALLQQRSSLGPALVVAPASVCINWLAEIEKFTPTLIPISFGEGSDRINMIETAEAGDIVVVTYDLMARETELFVSKRFATIVLDEAQAIKNRATKRSETAMALQGDFKLALSGTPIENHLGELWNLFQFLNPGLLGSIELFTNRFAIPIEKNKDDAKREQLKRLISPFMLRRRKDDVLKELPSKTEITLKVALSAEEKAFYEALRRQAIQNIEDGRQASGPNSMQVLAEISRLRRAACNPLLVDTNSKIPSAKLKAFAEIVEELRENGHRALVFSQFVTHLKILSDYLEEQDITFQYLDGSTTMALRQKRIELFQKGEGDLFLISLKAGGAGLNLTAADYVIHMDPWWNPAVEDQASDRAHRIGQLKPVTVYRIVAENTIEEQIIQMHEHKRDLADALLEGTDMGSRLNANELLEMLQG
jgi:SNF2 family DNA or RNA helicase